MSEHSATDSGATGPNGAIGTAADRLPELQARLRDAALGELADADLAQLQAEIQAHPAQAELRAQLKRLDGLLQQTQEHPGLQVLQPSEIWRAQTLHKAKIAAARLRKLRRAQELPVARPPLTHRQLAGKTPKSVSVDPATEPEFRLPGAPQPGIRKLFLLVAVTATAGVLVLAFLMARLLHAWQASPVPAGASPTPPSPTPALAMPLSPQEMIRLKVQYHDCGQVLDATADTVRFELGGAVQPPGWQAEPAEPAGLAEPGAGSAAGRTYRCEAPPTWDRMDLEGDLTGVALRFVADHPQGLSIRLQPQPAAAVGAATPAIGWELQLGQQTAVVVTHAIPAPTGGPARALAIERVTLRQGEEQLRFLAVATPATPATPVAAGGRPTEWEVLSERFLPAPCPPGHWVLELPPGRAPETLQYILQVRLPRAELRRTAEPVE